MKSRITFTFFYIDCLIGMYILLFMFTLFDLIQYKIYIILKYINNNINYDIIKLHIDHMPLHNRLQLDNF